MKMLKLGTVLCAATLLFSLGLSGCGANEAEAAVPEEETAVAEESGTLPEADASDFVLLAEAVPDAILEIRYYSTYNFVGDRIDGYEEPVALLTKEAAAALKEASDDLMARGYRLKIYDAYRPQMAVSHFVRWAEDLQDTRMKEYFYPGLDKSVLFDQGYIAAKSGHSRGITEQQYQNRMLLREVMLAHGFKPIDTEWWHFTLADEPYPDTYFTFPVNSDSVRQQ